MALQLRDTQDRASPEPLASSLSCCSGADRGGSGGTQTADGPAQPPCYWSTAAAAAVTAEPQDRLCFLPVQGPRCWEATRRAHRAGGVTGTQRTPPEPSPGYRGPVWASPVMETLEFICKGENCVSENGTCLSVPNTREGNGNPLQYSHLKNSMDRGAWWASHGSSWLDLSDFTLQAHQPGLILAFQKWLQTLASPWPQDPSSSPALSHLAALCGYEGSKEMTGKHHQSSPLHAWML